MPKLQRKRATEGQDATTRSEVDLDAVLAKLSLFGDLWMTRKDRREVRRADKKIDEKHKREMHTIAVRLLRDAVRKARAASNACVIK